MPRTKYIVVFFVLLAVVLLVFAVYVSSKGVAVALSIAPQTALVIDSVGDSEHLAVVVETDTTREDMRASLRAALRGYSAPVAVSPQDDDVVEEPVDTIESEAAPLVTPPVPAFCTVPRAEQAYADSWGGVTTSTTAAIRSVTSLALDGAGSPVNALDLPLVPVIESVPICPQSEMVGIAFDGRVIKADTPFVTDREGIVGFALDGFGIFNKYENGVVIVSSNLDQCHGHIHTIVWNDVPMSLYHYHVTDDAPYTIGCFRGVPALP